MKPRLIIIGIILLLLPKWVTCQYFYSDTLIYDHPWPKKDAVWYYKNIGYDTSVKYIRVGFYKNVAIKYGPTGTWYQSFSYLFQFLDKKGNVLDDTIYFYWVNHKWVLNEKGDTVPYFDKMTSVFIPKDHSFNTNTLYLFSYTPPTYYWSTPVIQQVFKNTGKFYQTDTGTITINGIKLYKGKYNAVNPCFDWGDMIIEDIGSNMYFFPLDNCSLYPIGGPLICYYDAEKGLYKTNINCPCLFENQEFELIYIYPNPVADVLTVQVKNPDIIYSIRILNSSGQPIFTITNEIKPYFEIVTQYFNSGLYFLEFTQGDQFKVLKFIKL